MAKVTVAPTATPATPVKVPHDKIAMRAYEKWCGRGGRTALTSRIGWKRNESC